MRISNLGGLKNSVTNKLDSTSTTYSKQVASANSTGTSNVWTKVAVVNFASQTNSDFNIVLNFVSANARVQTAKVCFTSRQSTTGSAPIYMFVDIMNITYGNMWDESCFKIVNNGFGTDFTIYMKKINGSGSVKIYEEARSFQGTPTVTYYSGQTWDAVEPTGTYESKSSSGKVQGYGASYYDLVSPYTGNTFSIIKSTTKTDNVTSITDSDVDDIFYFKRNGNYYRRSGYSIDMRDVGAGIVSDDTALFTKAIAFSKTILLPAGTYKVRDLSVTKDVSIIGVGTQSIVQFAPSGNDSNDASSWTIRSEGAFGKLMNFRINGNFKVGNGLLLVPTSDGLSREISGLEITYFTAYVATPTASSYGVNQNYTRNDLVNLVGGNGIKVDTSTGNPAWELKVDNIFVKTCDGVGLDLGNMTDSKLTRIYIGNCVKQGVTMTQCHNMQLSDWKIYRCRMLNNRESFTPSVTKIIPYSDTVSGDVGAVLLAGSNIQATNIELQENGSIGLQLGTNNYSLFNTSIKNVLVDGNGGIDLSLDATTNSNWRRYGIFAYNYYKVSVQGVADDFRQKANAGRQAKALFGVTSKPTVTSVSSLIYSHWYKIKTVGDANFLPFMGNQAGVSNTVGQVFQARKNISLSTMTDTGGTFGTTGVLEAVNDYLNIDLISNNQYDTDVNQTVDYQLGSDGINSTICINGVTIKGTATLTPATSTTLGGIKVGSGLSVTGDGTLSSVATASKSSHISAIQAGGSNILFETAGITLPLASSSTGLSTGNMRYTPVYVSSVTVLTGVKVLVRAQGVYTASNENRIGLYQWNGTALTLVASSANDGNIWMASTNTFITAPFTSQYTAQPGLYLVSIIYNSSAQTTAPSLASYSMGVSFQGTPDLTTNLKLYANQSATALVTNPPLTGISASTVALWVGLY